MMRLGQISSNRDNNLNLVRAVAATAVLVSHAYPIALGPGTVEPLSAATGHALGSLAVYLFFIVSGFLITGSYLRRDDPTAFAIARALRLFPGLLVSLLLVALVMGPVVSELSPGAYLTTSETWAFLLRNLSLIAPVFTLPGVFTDTPYPAVEGSIWTLFFEVACYVGVFALGVLGWLKRPGVMGIVLAAFLGLWLAREVTDTQLPHHAHQFLRLGMPFALGVAAWIWRDHIPMHWAGVLGLAAVAWLLQGTSLSTLGLMLALGYGTFWLAYVPDGLIRGYNRVGDFSYGIYIYAFPCQGLAIWIWGPMDPLMNMVLGFALALPPSILSWYLVEQPCLRRAKDIARWIKSPAPRSGVGRGQ